MNTSRIAPAVVIVLAVTCTGLAQQPLPGNPVVLTVNGEKIYAADIGTAAQGVAAAAAQAGMEVTQDQIVQIATGQVVDATLLAQEAKKIKIEVDSDMIDGAVADIEKNAGGREALLAALAEVGMGYDQLRQSMAKTLYARAYVDSVIRPKVSVSDQEVQSFYQENPEMFAEPEKVKARHILIKSSLDEPAATVAAARARAEAARAKVVGGEDFATVAKELSEGPSAPRGGDLGWIARDQMVEPFATVAFTIEPGSISDVVKTRFGFHVILVEEHREAMTPPLDEVQEDLRNALKEKAVAEQAEQAVKALREKAEVVPTSPPGGDQG